MLTRDAWLTRAMELCIEKVYKPVDIRLMPIIRIAAGVCPGKSLGFVVPPKLADDGACNIWITAEHGPEQTLEILGPVVHELCHVAVEADGYDMAEVGHGHPFTKFMKMVGLEGKPKSCGAKEGTELYATLQGIASELGPYEHKPLRRKEKKTRQSDVVTWVSTTDPEFEVKAKFSVTVEKGIPRDPSGVPMEPKDKAKFAEIEARFEDGLDKPEETEEKESDA